MSLPKTTLEQRSRFYTDVEALLSPGFLTHQVVVAGVRLQLRSLAPGDLFMLRARAEGASNKDWRVWMLASSIWLVDGMSVLGTDSAVPMLARYLRQLPDRAVTAMFSVLLGLFARSQQSVSAVLVYCYEVESRYKWATFGKEGGNRSSGVEGADKLGLNTVQQIWLAFNQYEDQKAVADQQWEGFKLVASSNSPKALKKLDEKDRQRARDEQERRERALDTFYYGRLGLVDARGVVQTDGLSHRLSGPKSVEDLEEEMRRWVTGDVDLHDKVVEEYKARIRSKREEEKADQVARRIAIQMERNRLDAEAAEGEFKPQPLLALSGEQLQQMLQGRGTFGRSGTTYIPTAPSADRLYNKYVADGAVTPGQLQVAGTKVIDPQADPAADTRTLNQLIKGRNPTFGEGE